MTNYYQANTSESKLRGQYYTPAELVQMMVGDLRLGVGDCIIDPACGDGQFLRGVVAVLASGCPSGERESLGRALAGRLIGFDIDATAVEKARAGLHGALLEHFGVGISAEHLHIHQENVLDYSSLPELLRSVGIAPPGEHERLTVIGNPPYVEAKRLDAAMKARLKKRFPEALLGAADLCLYFMHVCLSWLRADDRLAFVLPNKMPVNACAQRLREQLLSEGRLTQIWFATQAQIFPDAAVYPVVIFAQGATEPHPVAIRHLVREGVAISAREPIFVQPELYRRTTTCALFPMPDDAMLRSLLERLFRQSGGRLDDVLDIRWSVSFHRGGLREQYVMQQEPASAFGQRFLGGGAFTGNGEVVRYGLQWAGWWIDYDEQRLKAEGNQVPPLSLFQPAKIIFCQNGRTLRAAFDAQGFVLKDTLLCGTIREVPHPLCRFPRAIVGLLSSKLIHFFYSHVFYGGHVNDGYLHFLRSFLIDVPLGEWTAERAERVDGLVRQREVTRAADAQVRLEDEIEGVVREAFGLTKAEVEALEEWIGSDVNWQKRERVRKPGGWV